jgi:ADP-ribose pyrophosphatase YjhB (NUDIX family)
MKAKLYKLIRPVLARASLLTRGMTMGVRGAAFDGRGRVLLVKHSYVSGWHLPGGGVEVGETAEQALARELLEEGNLALHGAPVLVGLYHQPAFSPRDHVALYVVRDFTWGGRPKPNGEIVDADFFGPDALPEDTTPATRRRLAELRDGTRPPGVW